MSILDTYRNYFDIDPDYFPAVNEAVIAKNPEMWKKFYPHTTFIKLLKDTVNALTRKQKLSIWVEGAYGTGKSHAVLTLKKLLDATEEETREYFQKFNLDNDLFNLFQGAKNSGEILTVHRYGTSAIRGDHNLFFAIQESIENTLKEKGIKHTGNNALKGAILEWLKDADNKRYFDSLITGAYSNLFGGDKADDVIEKLNDLTGEALLTLMNKIFTVSDERNIKMLSLDAKGLADWIKALIKENNLKAIVFIWDEFTEYFNNNKKNLTGFQEIIEISETDPFYLMIVTHKSAALFDEGDKDKSKILGRFIKPTCIIELPENMAIQLMGAAMEKSQKQEILEDWDMMVEDLYSRTNESRKLVKQSAKISDDEMKDILPIHPYTALLLKYISSAFDSNQRSMFDFIKNDQGDEIKGFQWYIDNYGPEDENPLLTIDMLWEFFYEKGKESLTYDIRSILDCYGKTTTKKLAEEEKRVLKTVLLLQAISQKVGDSVELFIPDEKNINNAFEGSDMDNGGASRCAEKLVRDEVLYKKPLGGGKSQYSALVNAGDMVAIDKFKEDVKKKSTSALMDEGELYEAVTLGGALKLRYMLNYVSASDFDSKTKLLRNKKDENMNKIVAIVTFAKDDAESAAIAKKIRAAMQDKSYEMIFIDTSMTPLGRDGYEQYCENMSQSMYYQGKDNNLAKQYDAIAKESLKKWKNKIAESEFLVYSESKPEGSRAESIEMLYAKLREINTRKFENCLEAEYSVTDNMYTTSALKQGVACGVNREVAGTYKSGNQSTKLEEALKEAWDTDKKYWEEKPYLLISKMKIRIKTLIEKTFLENGGRISIARIYDELKSEPFGVMPCNLTAFVMGFILREYIDENYSWSDGLTSDVLSIQKLQEMIDEIIKMQITPNPRYRDKYIVAMTEDEKAFIEVTSVAFDISLNVCSSIEKTRERIRARMKDFTFPIWTLKSLNLTDLVKTEASIVYEVIDKFCGIANNNNLNGLETTDNDIAYSIGQIYGKNPDIAQDLKKLLNREKCSEGMKAYIRSFEEGELINLAEANDDGGQYINVLRKKFDADAANWVWNTDTAENKIREVILEYKIVYESNKIIERTATFDNAISEWRDKCQYIRLSYSAAKSYVGEVGVFLELLCNVKKAGILLEGQKEKFYNLLKNNAEEFRKFHRNQLEIFNRVCEFYLEGLSNEDVEEIFKSIPGGMFTKDKSEYTKLIAELVETYKRNSKATKLKALWKEQTGTESPKSWSKKYKMSILCMVEEEKLKEARAAFGAINKTHSEAKVIEKAIEFLQRETIFFDKIQSEEAREIAFKNAVIKTYAVMLTDIDEIKDYLEERIVSEPYDWFGLPEVDKRIMQLAEAKYNQGGCEKALEKIDNMDVAEVKRYLKELIRDNLAVGIAIISGN